MIYKRPAESQSQSFSSVFRTLPINYKLLIALVASIPYFLFDPVLSEESKSIDKQLSPSIIIKSDKQISDSMSQTFKAIGNVRVEYPKKEIFASSNMVEYFKKDGKIILTGDVIVRRPQADSLKADKVVFFIENDNIIAESDSNAQVLTKIFLKSVGGE